MAFDEHPESKASAQAQPGERQGGFANRLIHASSPYLLQHAHNPVDWYPWGAEAIERARREDKPIFLSIGYAACHWCHVMEHLVFERADIAALMNERFINIKVDREERPDLDDLYMMATQIMTGQGGWPMSVWLTPLLEPFYAGTYFPPTDAHGRPGFPRLLVALSDAWQHRRGELLEQSRRVVEAIRMHADESGAKDETQKTKDEIPVMAWIRTAIEQMADRFDEVNGGLGSAPKFPPHQALQLWLALLGDSDDSPALLTGAEQRILAAKVTRTLDGMMNGGLYDHVGGGFARYSTDERWLVPHFEKMLYDSAQLAPIYATASVLLGRPDYARVAAETVDFFIREMMSDLGAFYSSLDADSEGAEGKFYVWTLQDIHAALPKEDEAAIIMKRFGISAEGNWHESPVPGGHVLAIAGESEPMREEDEAFVRSLLQKMRAYRARRPHPRLDDKVLTAWNGLMISALAICGRVLREPKYLEAAHRLIGFLLTHHVEGGRRLLRVSRHAPEAAAHTDAFLDDHAYLLNGLMDLIDSTTPTSLPGTMARKRALELADTLVRDFEDTPRGGFFFTGPRHEQLFARMKNAADNATPSANAVAIRALLRLAHESGKDPYRETALRTVRAFETNIARRPEYFPTILLGLLEDARAAHKRVAGAATLAGTFPTGLGGLPGGGTMSKQEELISAHASELLSLAVDSVRLLSTRVGEGDTIEFEVALKLTIAGGYHIQSTEPADSEAFKTVARIRAMIGEPALLLSQEWTYPVPAAVDGATGFAGTIPLRARCTLAKITPGTHTFRATVLAQPCTGTTCLPPERISADFELEIGS